MDHTLSEMNPGQNPASRVILVSSFHLLLSHLSCLFFSGFLANILYECYISRPSHPSRFDHPNNISLSVKNLIVSRIIFCVLLLYLPYVSIFVDEFKLHLITLVYLINFNNQERWTWSLLKKLTKLYLHFSSNCIAYSQTGKLKVLPRSHSYSSINQSASSAMVADLAWGFVQFFLMSSCVVSAARQIPSCQLQFLTLYWLPSPVSCIKQHLSGFQDEHHTIPPDVRNSFNLCKTSI